jgi:F-type H+-transporting ATPase subunit a
LSTSVADATGAAASGGQNVSEYIIHHLVNSDSWHPVPGVGIPLMGDVSLFGIDMGLSLHSLMLIIAACVVFLLFGVLYKKQSSRAPSGITNMLEILVLFVRDEICINYMGEKDGRKLAPFFLNFFFLVLVMNLMGLIPIFSTATANINVTLGLSLITLTMMIIGGFVKHGPVGFFHLFLPPGVPKPIYVILFPIEIMGLFIKPFALTMRLFANMLGGHIVIFSLLGLIISFGWAGLPALGLALFIFFLELLVAFIQAYVFTMLSAMFVGSMLHPSH